MDDEYEDEPRSVETSICGLTPKQFLRLCDVAVTTRRGMVDRGFPEASKRLEAMGYLVAAGGGWQIAESGTEIIRLNSSRIPSL